MNCLIVGGSSGLGLCLAQKLSAENVVAVTGRRNPHQIGIKFLKFDLSSPYGLLAKIHKLVEELPQIDLLVYAVGYYQEGTITDLTESDISEMLHVGMIAGMYFTREILFKQGKLAGFIPITSTSQWIPRRNEPVYTAAKAGLAAYANSLSLDTRVGKTLIAAPAGMVTRFWRGIEKDTSGMLDPEWVADQILHQFDGEFGYKNVRIMRGNQVEVVEVREE